MRLGGRWRDLALVAAAWILEILLRFLHEVCLHIRFFSNEGDCAEHDPGLESPSFGWQATAGWPTW